MVPSLCNEMNQVLLQFEKIIEYVLHWQELKETLLYQIYLVHGPA
jgi:hypothetical protein